ncbi:MAG: tripartite tricarboxylate transporter substrate binding protein [Hydrogenophaga sp.]|uniref:Bug family tripartite tricarboxylate transporter substrate binding protein n=1 Tax=Hydrogenophaga sp. TaxID=1904254 RepID=UPI0025BB91E0|nr:tripartite tricarboxylate transporter substrate binding protein [Hydrogenophaga sp.]MBU7575668.1 tripartite tricarboxylate transporter substrate binding protein [Hydrogenophaga sp.]
MKTRSFLTLALALFAGLCSAQTAYPSRPVKVIVPLAAGGPVDLVARRVSERLTKQLGQPVMVENRAGGNGIIGANACKSAVPDGQTLCILLSDTLVINPAIYKKLPYTVGDFAPISEISRIDTAVVVSAALPIRSIQELVQYDRAHPGKLNWGHFGIGSSSHLFMAQVNEKLGARIVDVPYQGGGPALNGLLGDQVQVSSLSYSLVAQHIEAGKLRALAVLGDVPSPRFAGVPLLKNQGLGTARNAWIGLFAPTGTPAAVIARLSAEIKAITADPEFQKSLDAQGLHVTGRSPEETAAVIKAEGADWSAVAKAANVSLD